MDNRSGTPEAVANQPEYRAQTYLSAKSILHLYIYASVS
jgi:hypothetical protein